MANIVNRWRPYVNTSILAGTGIPTPLVIHPQRRPRSQAVRDHLQRHWNETLTVQADGRSGFVVRLEDATTIHFDDLAYRPEIGLYRQSDRPFLPSLP